MIGKMTYIDEVCAALLDDTEHKYLKARTHLGQVKEACDIPRDEHAHLIASAQREYLPSCPGGNADPSKFCPVGQQWSDAAQDCIVMS
jgi:hypothetical protein